MSKLGTSVARKDVNAKDDTIWRIVVGNETKSTRVWERNYDFLINKDRKDLVNRADAERRHERSLARNPPPVETKLFMSELMVIPEPPQRVQEKDKFYFKQDPERTITGSKMTKYYTHTLPPNKINPYETQPKTHHEFAATTKKMYSLHPNDTYEPATLYQYQLPEIRQNRKQATVRPHTVHNTNLSADTLKSTACGFNVTRDDPKSRFGNRKTLTSHDYGWHNTLEINKDGNRNIFQSHAKKSMVFD